MRLPFALSLLLWSSCGAPQLVELDGGSWFRGPGTVLMTLVGRDRSVRHLEAWSGDITLTTVEADRVTGACRCR